MAAPNIVGTTARSLSSRRIGTRSDSQWGRWFPLTLVVAGALVNRRFLGRRSQ